MHPDLDAADCNLNCNARLAAVSGSGALIGHYGNKVGLIIANRKAQAPLLGCSEPGEQMLRKHVMPARNLRHHRSRAQRLMT